MQDDRDRITGRLDEALPSRVSPLRSLHNHRITEGDPDVRGWEVYGADNRRIGRVDDLLVDTEAMKTRYLAVTLDLEPAGSDAVVAPMPIEAGPITYGAPLTATSAMGGLAPVISETAVRNTLTDQENRLTMEDTRGSSSSRRVLIPIGQARLDPQRDRIVVEGLRADEAAGLSDYDGGEIDSQGNDFYADDLYNEDRFYASRRTARVAGLEPGRGTAGGADREITGELDRAVDAPDHNVQEEAPLPGRRQ